MKKLLMLLSLGQSLHGKWVMGRLFSALILVAAMMIVSAMMSAGVLFGCFYAVYVLLLHLGLEPYVAVLIVLALAAACTVAMILSTMLYLKRLRELPHKMMENKSPLIGHAGEVVDAFINGFLNG